MGRPSILSIAGSDSGAGAGLQADARVIQVLGGYALQAVTAVTAQNTRGVRSWQALRPEMVTAQIRAVAQDMRIDAVKTGLIAGADQVEAIARAIPRGVPLVVDPVIGSTSGTRFLGKDGVRALRKWLLPHASLVTPNWGEAAALSGSTIASVAEAKRAALALLETGCEAVLVKGGHATGELCIDILAIQGAATIELCGPRIEGLNTHGTGCVLASAIATHLALGRKMVPAVEAAKRFLTVALERGQDRQWGGGNGPAFAGW